MKYGIAVFPSKEVQDIANSYRKRYDPHYTLIQPHVTIREQEEWDDARLRQAVAHLEQITLAMAPFSFVFNRFSTFYPVNHVIYMAPEHPQPLVDCHNRVCSGALAESDKRYSYTPHLTVGQEMTSDELHDIISSLRNRPLSFPVRVDRLHLLYQTDNRAWTAYQTFLLRGR